MLPELPRLFSQHSPIKEVTGWEDEVEGIIIRRNIRSIYRVQIRLQNGEGLGRGSGACRVLSRKGRKVMSTCASKLSVPPCTKHARTGPHPYFIVWNHVGIAQTLGLIIPPEYQHSLIREERGRWIPKKVRQERAKLPHIAM